MYHPTHTIEALRRGGSFDVSGISRHSAAQGVSVGAGGGQCYNTMLKFCKCACPLPFSLSLCIPKLHKFLGSHNSTTMLCI